MAHPDLLCIETVFEIPAGGNLNEKQESYVLVAGKTFSKKSGVDFAESYQPTNFGAVHFKYVKFLVVTPSFGVTTIQIFTFYGLLWTTCMEEFETQFPSQKDSPGHGLAPEAGMARVVLPKLPPGLLLTLRARASSPLLLLLLLHFHFHSFSSTFLLLLLFPSSVKPLNHFRYTSRFSLLSHFHFLSLGPNPTNKISKVLKLTKVHVYSGCLKSNI